jgi:sorbitol/mannitol transport system permease protein
MARAVSPRKKLAFTVIGWGIGLVIFFPILWTVLTSFTTEGEAIASPPSFVLFEWTTENYLEVQRRSNYFRHFLNSVVISFGSTLIGLAIAIPAAWAMAFSPTPRTKHILMWMLSTKMLPAVGKKRAGCSVGIVGDGRHHVGPNNNYLFILPGLNEGCTSC